tara:strand:- start:2754 stop:3515 length:762 start_codon:yes stop_codon:yes gene_type:complete
MNFDDVNIGGQLIVGTGVFRAIKSGWRRINGSAGIEGPVVIGNQEVFPLNEATLMVGPTTNDDDECVPATSSVGVSGRLPTAVKTRGNMYITGDLYVTGSVDCQSTGRLEARHRAADASPKKFDIVHPSQEGMRLAHACIEGAEVAIYHRGRVRNEKEIILPDYWKDLVHINSISVQLQPIGAHQDIIIKRWDSEKIYLQSKSGIPIDCFFHVYAERKDINPLVVEYEGETWEDYPDPDSNDPKYEGQNTRTL